MPGKLGPDSTGCERARTMQGKDGVAGISNSQRWPMPETPALEEAEAGDHTFEPGVGSLMT